MNYIFYIIGGVILLAAGWAVWAYNHFVALANRCEEAWADIDVQLKRRYDLIPNLINTVKGYAAHEKQTLERVTELRQEAMQPHSVSEQAQTENMLSEALKSLFAVSENYPDLKANENFLELQRELTDTENKIQAARRFYNSNVQALNTALESFPQNIIGNMFNFVQRDYFEIPEGEQEEAQQPVNVQF